MTQEELIAEARTHTKDIVRLSGEQWATMELLPKITVVDAVVVYFEGDQPTNSLERLWWSCSGSLASSSSRP